MKQRITCFVIFLFVTNILTFTRKTQQSVKAEESNQIVMVISLLNPEIIVNGKKITLAITPYIQKGCTMVSMDLFAFLKLSVYSNIDTNSYSITSPTNILKTQYNNKNAYVNTEQIKLGTPPIYKQNKYTVPIKSSLQVFGAKIEWKGGTQEIIVRYTLPDSSLKNKIDDGIMWSSPNPSMPYIPIPGEIDPKEAIKVELWDKSKTFRINNSLTQNLQQPPLYIRSNLLVPIEIFPSIFKIQTSYLAEEKRITLVSKGKTIQWQLYNQWVLVDNKSKEAEEKALIFNGSIYLPLPFMIHHLGGAMQWDVKNKKATILYDFSPYTEDPDTKPILSVSQTILDFGRQIPGSQPILSFKISNQNNGKLKGTLASSVIWIKLSATSFNDQMKEINVILDIEKLKSNLYREYIYIRSNGGNITLPVRLDLVDKKVVIEMQINQLKAKVDDRNITLPCSPFLEKSTIYVPLRLIAESFGSKIEWKANIGRKSAGVLTIFYKDIVAVLETNKSSILLNGISLMLKQPVFLKNGALVCPIEAVMAIFHPLMDFDGEKQILRLTF